MPGEYAEKFWLRNRAYPHGSEIVFSVLIRLPVSDLPDVLSRLA